VTLQGETVRLSNFVIAAVVAFLLAGMTGALASSGADGGGQGGAGQGAGGGIYDLDPGVTNVVGRARERSEGCRSPEFTEKEKIDCIARVLDQVANELRRKPGYRRETRIFRNTANAVRQSATVEEAVAAVDEGKRELLRSDGTQPAQARELAQVMDNARSVLRS
jgi:hypothetical protein